ncbi:roadblock/LC7 domain-containing protein [Streptomyces sp. NPDC005438]|uniref:roadblock/LC7 domain-containing protein n=1 Tax=Streptomyces sp. NPDC005438 TaxID=3156880 RepID=UPI0033B0DF5D
MTLNSNLDWMLDDVLKLPGTRHALLVSNDGLLRASAGGMGRDEAEPQAAALGSLQSISRSIAPFCTSGQPLWRQTLVEFEDGFVFLIAAGEGAYLAVSTSGDVDMEAVTYRMHKLVDRMGQELTVPLRQATGPQA